MNTTKNLFLLLSLSLTALFIFPNVVSQTTPSGTQQSHKQLSIIFDLNGVLIHNEGEAKILGMGKLIRYALWHGFNTKKRLREKLFEFLNSLEKRQPHETKACDEQGNVLPQIMCHWLKGTKSPAQLLSAVDRGMANQSSSLESTIVHSVATMMFDPEQFLQTQAWSQESLAFVQELKNQGCKVYILSNWDPTSFALMRRHYGHILSMFDGVMVSGDVGKIKPNPALFEHALKTFSCDREYTFFVDDQAANTRAAGSAGIANMTYDVKKGLAPLRATIYTWMQQRKAQIHVLPAV